jgi:hypothetical protein
MDWVTAVWATLIGGCVAMALPHLLVGLWQQAAANKARASKAFESNLFVLANKAFEANLAFENLKLRRR